MVVHKAPANIWKILMLLNLFICGSKLNKFYISHIQSNNVLTRQRQRENQEKSYNN